MSLLKTGVKSIISKTETAVRELSEGLENADLTKSEREEVVQILEDTIKEIEGMKKSD